MEDLEQMERQRIGLFCLAAFGSGLIFFIASASLLAPVLAGVSLGLLLSGVFVARATTRAHHWAFIESEARLNGYNASKTMVWVGNLLPFGFGLICSIWWQHQI